MLWGLIQAKLFDNEFCMKQIEDAESPKKLMINKRGDTMLHFTDMCGRRKPFESLLLQYDIDINTTNSLDQTVLVIACHAG